MRLLDLYKALDDDQIVEIDVCERVEREIPTIYSGIAGHIPIELFNSTVLRISISLNDSEAIRILITED